MTQAKNWTEAAIPDVGTRRPPLPSIDNAAALLADDSVTVPPWVIVGVLHQTLKAVLGSTSKASKTWLLLYIALKVATGGKVWKWPTEKGRVLYINFEIPRAFIRKRIQALAESEFIEDVSNLDIWTLRGRAAPLTELLPELIQRIREQHYSLVIIDPIYKALGDRDENGATDVASVCNELEEIACQTGAAVMFAAHFAKGNAAGKNAIDRISGSGVYARDPDTIITLTPHSSKGAYTVELVLRNCPEQAKFVVEWSFPLMVERPDLDPEDLATPVSRTAKGKTIPTVTEYLTLFPVSWPEGNPRHALREGPEERGEFTERGWSVHSVAKVRGQAIRQGVIATHKPQRGNLLIGRPKAIQAFAKQLTDEKAHSEQPVQQNLTPGK